MNRTRSAGGVVMNRAGLVLVVNQHRNSWSLPKGHVDAGETALQAATREIYEESGIRDLRFVKRLGSYERHRIGPDGIHDDVSELKTIEFFFFQTDEENLKPLDSDNPEARWVPAKEVPGLLTHPKDRDFFMK